MNRSHLRTGTFVTGLIASAFSVAPALAANSHSQTKLPSLSGKRLDVAELLLTSSGLRFKELGGGTFGIIVKSNWIVCETLPHSPGTVAPHSRVTLVVARRGDC
jgi:hypothetical protein